MNRKLLMNRLAALQLFILLAMATLTFFFTDYHYRKLIVDQGKQQIIAELDSFESISKKHDVTEKDICSTLYLFKSIRLSLIDRQGVVVCDSLKIEEKLDNHLHRPEIDSLKNNAIGFDRRKSATSAKSNLYGARHFKFAANQYYLRGALSLEDFGETVYIVWKLIILVLLPALLLLSLFLLRQLYLLDQKNQDAHQKLKGDLVANISHEVRTPLTSIIGYLQLLESDICSMTSTQQDYFSRLKLSVSQLNALFADVLELSLLENEVPLNIECLNSRDLIEQIVRKVEMVYYSKKITIHTDIADFEFLADGKLIEMVFKNIIDNAFKYSKANSEIQLIFKRDDQICRFICRDRGTGISDDIKDRIFERFYRGSSARESGIPGTGLGLAIAKHAINRHHGKIWCASVLNHGTSFFVELPSRADS